MKTFELEGMYAANKAGLMHDIAKREKDLKTLISQPSNSEAYLAAETSFVRTMYEQAAKWVHAYDNGRLITSIANGPIVRENFNLSLNIAANAGFVGALQTLNDKFNNRGPVMTSGSSLELRKFPETTYRIPKCLQKYPLFPSPTHRRAEIIRTQTSEALEIAEFRQRSGPVVGQMHEKETLEMIDYLLNANMGLKKMDHSFYYSDNKGHYFEDDRSRQYMNSLYGFTMPQYSKPEHKK